MRARQISHLNSICAGTGYKDVIDMIFQLLTCYTEYTLSLSSIYFNTATRVVSPELEYHVKIGRCSRVVFHSSKLPNAAPQQHRNRPRPTDSRDDISVRFRHDFPRTTCLYGVKCQLPNCSQKIETSCYRCQETMIKTLKHECANIGYS